ncbi:hypothetical protein L6R52_14770 [Myxococcota bacterium]|nr:hypothetical protein [Myxococcota bacterium]
MEIVLPSLALCVAGLLLGTFTLGNRRGHQRRVMLEAVAARLGLVLNATRQELRARGTIDGFDVEIDAGTTALHDRDDLASVTLRGGGIPRSMTLAATDAWTVLGQLFDRERVFTHDGVFDAEVSAQGDEAQLVALLDQDTRQLVLRALRGRGAHVGLGRIELELTSGTNASADAERIHATVVELVELAKRLSIQGPSLTERLEHNARFERHASVRAKNLTLLVDEYPESPAARRAAVAALDDVSPDVRLIGAVHLGDEGFAALAAIAEDERGAEESRLRALLVLVKQHPKERALPVLERVLASSSYAMRVQAVSAMAALGHYPNEQRARLEELIASADPRAIKAVAKLLETPAFQALDASEAFEPILIGLLGHDPAIASVAIDALAKVGSVRAVEPLLAFTRRILVDGTLKRAARDAIEQIQLRLDDVEGGRLSLAHDSDVVGALSLEDVRGAVSLPPPASKKR